MHETPIRRSIELAAAAKKKGNHPFGAVLVRDGKILMEGENSIAVENDVTRHAELNLVSQAVRQYSPSFLGECILYASTEPCAMCAGAIYWAGIRRVVYGCSSKRLAELAGPGLHVPCGDLLSRGAEPSEVIGPILPRESEAVHLGYWPGA